MATYLGDRVTFQATFKDEDGELYNPSAISLYIYDPQNGLDATKTKDDMSFVSLGIYKVSYDISSDGIEGCWHIIWKATHASGGDKLEHMAFQVREPNINLR